MAFLGRERWDPAEGSIYRALQVEARSPTTPADRYDHLLTLTDDPAEIVAFIQATPPQPRD
jgi:hypothetical protein